MSEEEVDVSENSPEEDPPTNNEDSRSDLNVNSERKDSKKIPPCRENLLVWKILFPLKWLLEYITIDVWYAFKNPLEYEDVPDIPNTVEVKQCEREYLKIFSHPKMEIFGKIRFFMALLFTIFYRFLLSALLAACSSILLCFVPFFMQRLLHSLYPLVTREMKLQLELYKNILPSDIAPEGNSFGFHRLNDWGVWIWLLAMILAKFFQIVFYQNSVMAGMKNGTRLYGLICSLVFKKSMKLSNKARSTYNLGKIMNIMSTDVWKVAYANEFTVGVLIQVFFIVGPSIFFVINLLGLPGVYGVLVGSVVVPISVIMFIIVIFLTRRLLKKKDTRVKLLNEVVQGIQIIKLFNWEKPNLQRIGHVRNKEVRYNRIRILIRAIGFSALYLCPSLMALVAFSTYISQHGFCDPVIIFSSMAYFESIRVPIIWLPFALVTVCESFVSADRIQQFLEADELDELPRIRKKTEDSRFALRIQNGSFLWEKSEEQAKGKEVEKFPAVYEGKDAECWIDDKNALFVILPVATKEKQRIKLADVDKLSTRKHGDGTFSLRFTFSAEQAYTYREYRVRVAEDVKNTLQGKLLPRLEKGAEFEEKELGKLSEINLEVKEGSLCMIAGKIGSGKSSLLNAILGNMKLTGGEMQLKLSEDQGFAYCNQVPFVLSRSVRDNIILSEDYDKTKFDKVVACCGLTHDMTIFKGGEKMQIGEKGVTISGGQKYRVSLARACYADASSCPIVVLDDPLAAVDSHVGRHIMDKCICGFLKNRTRILVTHQLQYLSRADHVVIVDEGRILEQGSFEELNGKKGGYLKAMLEKYAFGSGEEGTTPSPSPAPKKIDKDPFEEEGEGEEDEKKEEDDDEECEILKEEERFKGNISMKAIYVFMKSMGIPMSVLSLLIYIVFQCIISGNQVFLANWTGGKLSNVYGTGYNTSMDCLSSSNNFTTSFELDECVYSPHGTQHEMVTVWWKEDYRNNTVVSEGAEEKYLVLIYVGIAVLLSIFQFLREIVFQNLCVTSSNNLHNRALKRVVYAPQSFFDTTPVGRIINRLTTDVENLDVEFPVWMQIFLDTVFNSIGILIITCVLTWGLFVPFAIPVVIIYFSLYYFYRRVGIEGMRLQIMSFSPLFSNLAECVLGASTIRAFGSTPSFVNDQLEKISVAQRILILWRSTFQWVMIRADFIGLSIIFLVSVVSIVSSYYIPRNIMSIATCSLLVTLSLDITNHLDHAIRCASGIEQKFASIERLYFYSWRIPIEGERVKGSVPKNWPAKGAIQFVDYSMKYRENTPLVLKDINLTVNGCEKIGVCGRTGSGKSSLMLALFRIAEPAAGKILVDGVDITSIGLDTLRSTLAIIPQDPKLFDGTISTNLDPFGQHPEQRLWEVLESSHLKETFSSRSGLATKIEEEGKNFSVGERQLICLARAMLKGSKIIVLDECTSSVDMNTDELIQKTIQEQFKDCTLLTIAHRLNTIIEYDRILVLDDGTVAEFDSPKNLLMEDEYKHFKKLVKKSGKKNEEYLRSLFAEVPEEE